jgi:hypothetical protein
MERQGKARQGKARQGKAGRSWRIEMRRAAHPLRVVSISDEMRLIETR